MQRLHELDGERYRLPPELRERTLTPALAIFTGPLRENVRRMLARIGGPERWRPHLKTTKTPEIWRELFAVGVRQFKCATTREARLCLELAEERGEPIDLLIAYPLIGANLVLAGRLAAAFPRHRLAVLCEDPELAAALPEGLGLFVDVNPGLHRTGLPLAARAEIRAVAERAGPRFRGLHFYEGLVEAPDRAARRERTFALYGELLALVAELGTAGLACAEVVTSGTPAVLDALAHEPLRDLAERHRVSPGTVLLHDVRSSEDVPELELLPAALVLTRVVSHPRPGRATCDAGSKALAAEAGDPCALVLGRPNLRAGTPNEEHLPLDVVGDDADLGRRPARGELLRLVPRHVCPTVNLAEAAWFVEPDGAVRVVPIRGRAHELVLD